MEDDDEIERRIEACDLDGLTSTTLFMKCSINTFQRKTLKDPLFDEKVSERPEYLGEKHNYHKDSISSYLEGIEKKRLSLRAKRMSNLIRMIKPRSANTPD